MGECSQIIITIEYNIIIMKQTISCIYNILSLLTYKLQDKVCMDGNNITIIFDYYYYYELHEKWIDGNDNQFFICPCLK